MVFDSALNFIFGPLLKLSPLFAIIIVSFILSLITLIVYKLLTNQTLMKELKDDMKKHSSAMKDHKDNPQKMLEVQKQAMEANLKYMKHSMVPMIVNFIPIILIFGWFNTHLVYEPVMPGQDFTTTITFAQGISGNVVLIAPEGISPVSDVEQQIKEAEATWTLKGDAGEHLLEYVYDDKEYSKDLLITDKQEYRQPVKKIDDGTVQDIKIDQKEIKLNILGLKLSWFWTYVIFSIIFSITLRKILKIH